MAERGVGIGIALGGPYATLGAVAATAEARGFDAVWLAETSQDAIVGATHVVDSTSTITVGTNIALAFPRSPTVMAMAGWDLAELSGDRVVLGLGSQVRRIIEERFAAEFDHPARRMAEYIEAMRTVWRMERGEDVTYDGDLYRVLRPGLAGPGRAAHRALPPVYVAAVGPLMTRVAATHADGLLGHPFTSVPYLTDHVVPRIEAGLEAAGRDRAAFTLCQGVILCIADDRARAVREAKQQIAFYGTTPNYRGVFASYGDDHLTDRLRRVWRDTGRDLDALVAAVPDDAVARYAVAGTPDEVGERLAAFDGVVDHLILGGAWYGVPMSRLRENVDAILATFGR